MDTALKGRNALVCGASKGIGKATAIELAALGANVTVMSRTESSLREVLSELDNSQGQEHDILVADHSQPAAVYEKVSSYLKSSGREIHILINNSGGPPGGAITEASPEAFLQAFGNHLIVNQLLGQVVLEGMKKSGYGRIINVISTSVKQPLSGLGVSNTTRGAVANWAKTWANEVGRYGITVNNVLPGATETERLGDIITNKAGKSGKSETEITDSMKKEIPLARFGRPEEVAAAIAFLAAPTGAYISGINLPVDGGRLACL